MDQNGKEQSSGVLTASVDAAVALILMLIGAVVMWDNYRIGASWGPDGPQSGYFPFYIGLFILVSSTVTFAQALLARKRNREVFVHMEQLKTVLMVLIPSLVYVLGIQLVGIYVASTVFIALFMLIMGKYGWLKTAVVSIGVSAAFFWLFEIEFLVPLPKGPLEAMFGY